jgi:hypothetical protein
MTRRLSPPNGFEPGGSGFGPVGVGAVVRYRTHAYSGLSTYPASIARRRIEISFDIENKADAFE